MYYNIYICIYEIYSPDREKREKTRYIYILLFLVDIIYDYVLTLLLAMISCDTILYTVSPSDMILWCSAHHNLHNNIATLNENTPPRVVFFSFFRIAVPPPPPSFLACLFAHLLYTLPPEIYNR